MSLPSAWPAARASFISFSTNAGGSVGFTNRPMTAALGTSSCSISSCFCPSSRKNMLTPVTLPPGRLRLATRPAPTGSPPLLKTIGIVCVAALAASAAGSPPAHDYDDRQGTADQIGCQRRQSIVVEVRPAIFKGDVATLQITGF